MINIKVNIMQQRYNLITHKLCFTPASFVKQGKQEELKTHIIIQPRQKFLKIKGKHSMKMTAFSQKYRVIFLLKLL